LLEFLAKWFSFSCGSLVLPVARIISSQQQVRLAKGISNGPNMLLGWNEHAVSTLEAPSSLQDNLNCCVVCARTVLLFDAALSVDPRSGCSLSHARLAEAGSMRLFGPWMGWCDRQLCGKTGHRRGRLGSLGRRRQL
jgi:hypothetical protein